MKLNITGISSIIKNRTQCFFVSPHFDDAVFSAGGLILYLIQKHVSVTVINVFTDAHEPSTLSAKKFLHSCGYKTAESLYANRIVEDTLAMKTIGAKSINLGYVDALWRKKVNPGKFSKLIPELCHIYPTHRMHINKGVASPKDMPLIKNITKDIKRIVNKNKNAVFFSPLAFGKHVDHVIVRDIVTKLGKNIFYWADFPYSINYQDQNRFITDNNLRKFVFADFDTKVKEKTIKIYESQFKAIFPSSKLILPPETYYYDKKI